MERKRESGFNISLSSNELQLKSPCSIPKALSAFATTSTIYPLRVPANSIWDGISSLWQGVWVIAHTLNTKSREGQLWFGRGAGDEGVDKDKSSLLQDTCEINLTLSGNSSHGHISSKLNLSAKMKTMKTKAEAKSKAASYLQQRGRWGSLWWRQTDSGGDRERNGCYIDGYRWVLSIFPLNRQSSLQFECWIMDG